MVMIQPAQRLPQRNPPRRQPREQAPQQTNQTQCFQTSRQTFRCAVVLHTACAPRLPASAESHALSSPRLSLMEQGLKRGCWALAQEFQDTEERREELKRRIAIACSQLLRDPEAHTRNLRALLALTVDKDTEVMHRGRTVKGRTRKAPEMRTHHLHTLLLMPNLREGYQDVGSAPATLSADAAQLWVGSRTISFQSAWL